MILTASGLISGHPTSPDVRLRAQKAVSTTPAPGQHDGEGARLHRSTQPSSCIFIKYIYICKNSTFGIKSHNHVQCLYLWEDFGLVVRWFSKDTAHT